MYQHKTTLKFNYNHGKRRVAFQPTFKSNGVLLSYPTRDLDTTSSAMHKILLHTCDYFTGLDGHCPPSFKQEIFEINYQSGVRNVCWLLAKKWATSLPQTGYKLLEVLFLIFWKSKEVLNQDMLAIRSNPNPRFFWWGGGLADTSTIHKYCTDTSRLC